MAETVASVRIRKTYKEKLRPTPTQEQELERVLWRCRALYNTALEQRITAWGRCHVSVSRYEQEAELKAIRAEFPDYAAIHSHVLQDVLARLDKTYQAFFRRVQRGEKAGFPRFKSRYGNRYRSFTFKEHGNGARLDNGSLVLAKIGRISVHWSRPIEGTPKTVTVSKEADGWYVSFSCAEVPLRPLPPTGQETGIDLGLESFATLADGTRILTPGYYRRAERYLAKCQRRVSRRKKGSARRRKAVCWLAKAHQNVRRQRQDFHHKTALALIRTYDTIYHEELRVANMVRNHHLAKSIADAGWGAFLAILSFKAASAGRSVVAVDPAFTSQACSGCGVLVKKGLSVRWHACPDCGTSLHRDHNAALNIQWRPAAPSGTRGGACGDEPRTHRAASPCGVSAFSGSSRRRQSMSSTITFDISEVVARFTTFRVGVVVASGLVVRSEHTPELERVVQAAEVESRAALGETPLAEIPELRGWREAYKGFGVKKTSYRSSVERLLKKVLQGEPLPQVNTLVDAYNAIWVRYRMPVGADDLDRVVSPLGFRFSRPGDTFIALGDESQTDDPPYPGEVVYVDAEKCLCRRWNWYQDARSAICAETTRAVLTVQAIEPMSIARAEEAVAYLERLLAEHCGARTISAVLDTAHPAAMLQAE